MFCHAIYPLNQQWFLLIAAVTVLAGIVRGLTGFGSALILFVPLSIAVGPVMAAPIMQMLDYALAILLVPAATRNCRWSEVIPLSIGAVVFVPVGVGLLIYANGDILRRVASVGLLFVVAAMAMGWRYRGRTSLAASFGVGALSGLAGGATTLSGPPVALFWLGGQADAAGARNSIIIFFAISEFATLVAYAVTGLFSLHVLLATVALAIPFGLGLFIGTHAFRHVSERVFRAIALTSIALVALVSLVR